MQLSTTVLSCLLAVSFLTAPSLGLRNPATRYRHFEGWQNQRDITCCMLGQIAGDKGYHCFAKFYAARLLMRNRNRAHNRKMSFYGRNRIPDYGRRVMRTFEQCVVADRGAIFHKCCHLVAVERRDRIRYSTHHVAPSGAGNVTSDVPSIAE